MAKRLRRNPAPFGGIQLIITGDFYQLPPVRLGKDGCCFAFRAACWNEIIDQYFVLTEIRRQRDPHFIKLLKEIRHGMVSAQSRRMLDDATQRTLEIDKIKPTMLHCTNANVDRINSDELRRLPTPPLKFISVDWNKNPNFDLDKHDKQFRVAREVELKVDAQVMLLKNIDPANGLINGTRGVVIRFHAPKGSNELRHAHSLSADVLPVVQWDAVKPGTAQKIERIVVPEEWKIESSGHVTASRIQLPLRLAWALTIHKSQGMTISRLEMSLGQIFEPGQAYVALSRGQTLEGIRLIDYDVNRIRVHPEVEEFGAKLLRLKAAQTEEAAQAEREQAFIEVQEELNDADLNAPALSTPDKLIQAERLVLDEVPVTVFTLTENVPANFTVSTAPAPQPDVSVRPRPVKTRELTEDQKQRIKQSRQRALELLRSKKKSRIDNTLV